MSAEKLGPQIPSEPGESPYTEEESLYDEERFPDLFAGRDVEQYKSNLRERLARAGNIEMHPAAVRGFIDHLDGWEFKVEAVNENGYHYTAHILRKSGFWATIPIDSGKVMTDRRKIYRDQATITLLSSEILTEDILCMLDLDDLAVDFNRPKKPEPIDTTAPEYRYKRAKGEFLNEGDIFTAKEQIILEQGTEQATLEGIAKKLKISKVQVGRVLRATRSRLRVETMADLMLVAIANGEVSLDNIDPGKTESLSEMDKNFLNRYFSFDHIKRGMTGAKDQRSTMNELHRIIADMGIPRAPHLAFIYAAKDGIIDLPSKEELQARFKN